MAWGNKANYTENFAVNYLDGVLGKVDGVVGIGVVLGEVLAYVSGEAYVMQAAWVVAAPSRKGVATAG